MPELKHTMILEGVDHPDVGKIVRLIDSGQESWQGKLVAVHLMGAVPNPAAPEPGKLTAPTYLGFTLESQPDKQGVASTTVVMVGPGMGYRVVE